MREIARETQEDPQIDVNAPHTTPMKRVDESHRRKEPDLTLATVIGYR